MNDSKDRLIAELREKLAQYTENKQIGTCVFCGRAIWFRESKITDDRGIYHPICQVAADRDEWKKKAEEAESGRKHTQQWYAEHYAKLHEWARKRLPEEFCNEFFSCLANGTWSLEDKGEPYLCRAGFMVHPSGYIRFDKAQEQILFDQGLRAEIAEMKVKQLTELLEDM